jgi:multiple sugar transport system substrate-binding protein
MTTYNRRRTAGTVAMATIAGLALSSCAGGTGGDDGDVSLTLMAWANAEEAKMYEEVLDVFEEKNPGTTVKFEYSDNAGYKDKLNTKFAAGSPPDVMFLVGQMMGEYTSRDALLDLEPYSEQIDFDAMDQTLLKANTVDGKLYSIPTGSTSAGLAINETALAESGVALPDDSTWTWAEFGDWATAVTEASDGDQFGANIEMSWGPTFSTWVRQQGEDVYTETGELGVSVGTVEKWFEMNVDFLAEQAFPPAGTIDMTGAFSPEESPLGTGRITTTVIPANALPSYANVLGEDGVGLLRFPGETEGERRGMAVTPTLLWASPANTKHPEETAKLLDFLTNDPDSFEARGTFLGVPINESVAREVAETLTPSQEEFVTFVSDLSAEGLDAQMPEPPGAQPVNELLTSITTEVTFGRISPADAAERFIDEAAVLLEQAG